MLICKSDKSRSGYASLIDNPNPTGEALGVQVAIRRHPQWTPNKTWAVALLLMFWSGAPAIADVVVIRSGDEELTYYGLVIETTDAQVVFERRHQSRVEQLSIERDKVVRLIKTVDQERLHSLSPDQPTAYRDYAEALIQMKSDPVAQTLAIRLLLIAGHLSEKNHSVESQVLLKSVLRNLVQIARSDRERMAFETLAWLHGVEVALDVDFSKVSNQALPEEWNAILDLVRNLRRGQLPKAAEIMQDAQVQKSFQRWQDICTWQELTEISRVNRPTSIQLEKLLTIEVDIVSRQKFNNDGRKQTFNKDDSAWAIQASRHSMFTELLPHFGNVTEFDPKRPIYRDSSWIAIDHAEKSPEKK